MCTAIHSRGEDHPSYPALIRSLQSSDSISHRSVQPEPGQAGLNLKSRIIKSSVKLRGSSKPISRLAARDGATPAAYTSMDGFAGWSSPYAEEPCPPSRPSDDGLLNAFVCSSFHDGLRSDHGGLGLPPSHQIPNLMHGTDLSIGIPASFMGLDSTDVLPGVTRVAVDDGLLDTFAYVPNAVAADEPAQTTAVSGTAFFGYSRTTGGNGNISGESNTYGGHDTEVASPCVVSPPPALPQTTPTTSKRKLDKYPTAAAPAAEAATGWRGAKRATAMSSSSTSITFGGQGHQHHQAAEGAALGGGYEPDTEAIAQVKEMIYRAAAKRPVHQLVGAAAAEPSSSQNKPRRKNVRISSDPQTVAARLRRERISERLRVLQRLVPGGSRMDTASMLDEAASYLKFLKPQLKALESGGNPSNGSYHNGGLLQSYTGSLGGSGTSGSTVLAFGRDAIGGYVKSNRNMQL